MGFQPTEIEGPHGLAVGPDGKHWYVSIAHGKPFGLLYKYAMDTDKVVGECELGMFPATMAISGATPPMSATATARTYMKSICSS